MGYIVHSDRYRCCPQRHAYFDTISRYAYGSAVHPIENVLKGLQVLTVSYGRNAIPAALRTFSKSARPYHDIPFLEAPGRVHDENVLALPVRRMCAPPLERITRFLRTFSGYCNPHRSAVLSDGEAATGLKRLVFSTFRSALRCQSCAAHAGQLRSRVRYSLAVHTVSRGAAHEPRSFTAPSK